MPHYVISFNQEVLSSLHLVRLIITQNLKLYYLFPTKIIACQLSKVGNVKEISESIA